MAERTTPNLTSFNAYADENGQAMGQDEPNDVARPVAFQRRLASDPGGEAETARIASGRTSDGADAETEAETPPDTIRQISDPSLGSRKADEAVERATAGLGKPD